jgi:DNA-binding beta-propeller fold protein YncE
MKNFTSYFIRPVFRVALVALMFALPVGLVGAGEAPDFLTVWGEYGTGDGQFDFPNGIAVDSAGNVYVADTGNDRIQKFDAIGTYLTQWDGSEGDGGRFSQPKGIAVDSKGNVYVADTSNNRIQKFDADGTHVTHWGEYGVGDGEFSSPMDIAVDGAGNVYVADTFNNRIQKFDADGTHVTHWGEYGVGDGEFIYPMGIAVDSAGNVYVADYYNNRIQKFDADGTHVTQWGEYGVGDGEFSYPMGIAVDGAGNVYVADTGNDRIQKFELDGEGEYEYVTKWDGSDGAGQFSWPMGIAVDGAGNVYVVDTGNYRIQKFGNPFIDPDIDIRPWSCRNPLNMRSRGVLPVAILGGDGFCVETIDVSTITLGLEGSKGGVKPIWSKDLDVSGPLKGETCEWSELGPDGCKDKLLLFKTREVADAISGALGEVNHREVVVLTITGSLDDGTPFYGEDSVTIINRGCRKRWKWWKRGKGKK